MKGSAGNLDAAGGARPAAAAVRRYRELDGLRGLLALWVAVAHLIRWSGFGEIGDGGKVSALWHEFSAAEAAAETFIILSGFAICTLLRSYDAGWWRFVLGRFLRLWPVYCLCMILSTLALPCLEGFLNAVPWQHEPHVVWMADAARHARAGWWSHIAWHLPMLHGLPPASVLEYSASAFHAPAWTITVEWQFYLLAPLLLWLMRRFWGAACIVVLALIGRVTQDMWMNPDRGFVLYWLPYLFTGIGCSYLAAAMEKAPDGGKRMSGALIGAGIGAALFLSEDPLPMMIWAVAFTMAAGAWSEAAPGIGRMGRTVLTSAPVQWLGALSYPLYLLHWPLLIVAAWIVVSVNPAITQARMLALLLGAALPLILLASWLMHWFVERPAHALGRKLSGRA